MTLPATLHNGYLPGCVGRIVELHATYYAATAGFGVPFEAKVARELADFCLRFQPDRDGLWLAVVDGCIEGSIAIDSQHVEAEGAHLRWFILSERLRGQGMGKRLLAAATGFTDVRQYGRTYLWTFSGLDAARHLYEAAGFSLVHQADGEQWGMRVAEQRFERVMG